jgi:hypothetical protein
MKKSQISDLLNVLSIILMLVGFVAAIIWNFHLIYEYIVHVINAIRGNNSSESIASLIMLFFARGLIFFGILILCQVPAILCKGLSIATDD